MEEDKQQSNGCAVIIWGLVFAVVAGIIFVCCVLTLVLASGSSDLGIDLEQLGSTEELIPGSSGQQVAVIDINGTIIGGGSVDLFGNAIADPVEQIIGRVESSMEDDSVAAVVLRFNTGGGTVYDSFRIADEVRQVREQNDKPIIALVETSAASGGYLIAAQTDWIVSSQTSIVGSIGVIAEIQDTDGLLEKLGIETVRITSDGAEQKAGGDVTDENSAEYKDLKELLNDYQQLFEQYVKEGRDFTDLEIDKLADGSIESGMSALEVGLVDELGDLDVAVEKAVELADISGEPRVFEYVDEIPGSFGMFGVINSLIPTEVSQMRQRRGVELLF